MILRRHAFGRKNQMGMAMYATDLSAVLPPHERQLYDTLTAKAVQILRDQQLTQSAALSRKPVKPKGDRVRVNSGD